MMLPLLALFSCAADEVSPDRPVSGTYRITDAAQSFSEAENGTVVIDGDLMIFEYTDADGVAWKVTYVLEVEDSGADSSAN